jgi:DNA polymerase-3 subunit epsilon
VGRGRSRGEKSVVCVEGGKYKGFGYFEESEGELSLQEMRNYVKPYAHNRDIQKIICGYLKANVSDKQIRYQLNQESTEMSC